MKDGYLQMKIQELNDKCKQINQMLSMEKSKIELLEDRVGGLKELIKKFKDLEDFKENILKEIKKENQQIISEEIKSISYKMSKNVDDLLKNKSREFDNNLDYLKNFENKINKQNEIISDLNKNINYLLKHNELLMMKLVNKVVISDREVNELHSRSSKTK
jgi:DNA repair exonuclease SbcCD ATPase subunit